jgi:hypothetical protein
MGGVERGLRTEEDGEDDEEKRLLVEPVTAQRSSRWKHPNFALGLVLLLIVAAIWTGASYLVKYIFIGRSESGMEEFHIALLTQKSVSLQTLDLSDQYS